MGNILNILTNEEREFIKHHGISPEDIYDGRGEIAKEFHDNAKAHGCHFVINQCQFGHRLKTRSGHCIVCRPSNISFQKRDSIGGVIYVAYSGKYCKVGVTDEKTKSNQESLSDREYRLNSEGGYAGRTGWKYIKTWAIEKNLGKVERDAHKLLEKYQAEEQYIYSGNKRNAKEIFVCSIQSAIDAVKKAIELNK